MSGKMNWAAAQVQVRVGPRTGNGGALHGRPLERDRKVTRLHVTRTYVAGRVEFGWGADGVHLRTAGREHETWFPAYAIHDVFQGLSRGGSDYDADLYYSVYAEAALLVDEGASLDHPDIAIDPPAVRARRMASEYTFHGYRCWVESREGASWLEFGRYPTRVPMASVPFDLAVQAWRDERLLAITGVLVRFLHIDDRLTPRQQGIRMREHARRILDAPEECLPELATETRELLIDWSTARRAQRGA
ncbi:hypothetical protein LRS13_06330 [Svornostia abyssi]|uniref:Uncharacterized protein n=1 Tax=Svornostia abyssi TaxID=2898438 RepID=A0ABY5PKP3_9ACTN|nr:hypothetical protein LRS13_06330 [Parviterribacteraceae bacterium J379]